MAQLFKCNTIEQKKIERWLSDQGITAGDIADVKLSGPAMVRVTNPAGQYMDLYCDNAYQVRALDVTQEQEEALDRLWDEDPEEVDWRQDLTADEAAMVEQWDKQYSSAFTSLSQQIEAIEKQAPKAPVTAPHRDLSYNRNGEKETIMANTFEKSFIAAYLDGEARLDSIDAYIEYWHTHEMKCELHEFLGMTAYEYAQWLKSGKDDVLRNILESRNGASSLTQQIAALEERAPKAPAAAPYRVPDYEREL